MYIWFSNNASNLDYKLKIRSTIPGEWGRVAATIHKLHQMTKKLFTQWRSSKVRILKFWNTKSCMISFKQKNMWGGHQLSMRNALTVWFIDIEVSNPRVNMYLVNSSSGMALDHNGRLVSQYTRSGTIIITGGSRYSSSYEGMQEINGFTKTTIAFQFWSYRINRH